MKYFVKIAIMHVFIMLPFFFQYKHMVPKKYIINMWENVCFCNNIYYHFAKDIVLFYITKYHLCISRLSWDLISQYIIYHNYRITTLYITANQAKELDRLHQVQHRTNKPPNLSRRACTFIIAIQYHQIPQQYPVGNLPIKIVHDHQCCLNFIIK